MVHIVSFLPNHITSLSLPLSHIQTWCSLIHTHSMVAFKEASITQIHQYLTQIHTHTLISHIPTALSHAHKIHTGRSHSTFSYCDTPSHYLPGQTETYSSLSHTHWPLTHSHQHTPFSPNHGTLSLVSCFYSDTHMIFLRLQGASYLLIFHTGTSISLTHWYTLVSYSGFSQSSPW